MLEILAYSLAIIAACFTAVEVWLTRPKKLGEFKSWRLKLAAALILVAVALLARPERSDTIPERAKLVVGRLIEGDSYLQYVKESFELTYPEIQIEFVPPLGAPNENSPDRFSRIISDNRIDVYLGGRISLHEKYAESLGNINYLLERIPFGTPYDTAHLGWIGFYQKCLGLVWRDDCEIPESRIPRSFRTLIELPESLDVGIPQFNSSAAQDFFASLSGADSDPSTGLAVYRELATRFGCIRNGELETSILVALSELDIAVEWPHDAYSIRRDRAFSCLKIGIPDDAVMSLSGISYRYRQGAAPLVEKFINFVLSNEIQLKHYELEGRLPVSESTYRSVIVEWKESGALVFAPTSAPRLVQEPAVPLTTLLKQNGLKMQPELNFQDLNEYDKTMRMGCSYNH